MVGIRVLENLRERGVFHVAGHRHDVRIHGAQPLERDSHRPRAWPPACHPVIGRGGRGKIGRLRQGCARVGFARIGRNVDGTRPISCRAFASSSFESALPCQCSLPATKLTPWPLIVRAIIACGRALRGLGAVERGEHGGYIVPVDHFRGPTLGLEFPAVDLHVVLIHGRLALAQRVDVGEHGEVIELVVAGKLRRFPHLAFGHFAVAHQHVDARGFLVHALRRWRAPRLRKGLARASLSPRQRQECAAWDGLRVRWKTGEASSTATGETRPLRPARRRAPARHAPWRARSGRESGELGFFGSNFMA